MEDVFEDAANEETITIKEYIEEVEAQEMEADMVLGGDEGKDCTYPGGYLNRQAVFACMTCTPAGNAGVCTACSLTCHDGHQVVELWTRRRFRCDCGNSKFGGIPCKLLPDKDVENLHNVYNQNYKGLYCVCHRPYPDPDEEEPVEMIQCCICEDWFHESHLGLEPTEQIPRDDEGNPIYDDFVCKDCVFRCSFLLSYTENILIPSMFEGSITSSELQSQLMQPKENNTNFSENGVPETVVEKNKTVFPTVTTVLSKSTFKDDNSEEPCSVNIDSKNYGQLLQYSCAGDDAENGMCKSTSSVQCDSHQKKANEAGWLSFENEKVPCCISNEGSQPLNSHAVGKETGIMSPTLQLDQASNVMNVPQMESACKFRNGLSRPLFLSEKNKPLFLGKNWRELLCKCSTCKDLYATKEVTFLLDQGDSIEEYEEIAKRKRDEKLQQQEGAEMKFLQTLGHVQQIELLSGFSEMKNELQAYLGSFDTAKVVTSEDIHEFFQNLKRKRQRLA